VGQAHRAARLRRPHPLGTMGPGPPRRRLGTPPHPYLPQIPASGSTTTDVAAG
jgi:hypothetical protein